MSRRKEITELAALLDGELEAGRAEQLYAQLQDDPELQAEYELQRAVKVALAQLPQDEAPDFLATRVLGEISKKGHQPQAWRWRTLAAALAGFSVCLLLVSGLMYLNRAPFRGFIATRPVSNIDMADQAVLGQPILVTPFASEWGRDLHIPANADEGMEDFLQFANRAHGYTKYVNSTDSIKPDLPSAILVLDGKLVVVEDEPVEDEEE